MNLNKDNQSINRTITLFIKCSHLGNELMSYFETTLIISFKMTYLFEEQNDRERHIHTEIHRNRERENLHPLIYSSRTGIGQIHVLLHE